MTDVIRQLRPGERVPDSQPRRYISDHGYMRLRWHVGIARYVETYEHRVFDGVVTTAEHVHHINGRKTDNRVENRQCMTADEHNAHHADHRKPRAWAPFRSYTAMRKAAEAENRRFDIARRTERMRELSAAGLTTGQIGAIVGLDRSAVSRYLTRGRNW